MRSGILSSCQFSDSDAKNTLLLSFPAVITESSLVILSDSVKTTPQLTRRCAAYFDAKTKTLVSSKLADLIPTDINDSGLICGRINNQVGHALIGFIWDTKENKINYFDKADFIKVLNNGHLYTWDGFKIIPNGEVEKLQGQYITCLNKKGQYPSDDPSDEPSDEPFR